jgi:two-component system response regulator WspF
VAPAKPGLASCELVVIGASTGGPSALAELFSQIPSSINAAFVVVQHVDRQFAQGLASWLDSFGRLKVELARPGESPERGKALVACTNDHLILDATNRFLYVKEPEENPFRPSVDVFFNSVVASCRQRGLAVLLTGIGRDGAVGLFNLRKAAGTLSRRARSLAWFFGMPKAAIETRFRLRDLDPARNRRQNSGDRQLQVGRARFMSSFQPRRPARRREL